MEPVGPSQRDDQEYPDRVESRDVCPRRYNGGGPSQREAPAVMERWLPIRSDPVRSCCSVLVGFVSDPHVVLEALRMGQLLASSADWWESRDAKHKMHVVLVFNGPMAKDGGRNRAVVHAGP